MPEPVPVRPDLIEAVRRQLIYNDECGPGPVSLEEYTSDALAILDAVAPLIAAEAAAHERARIVEFLREQPHGDGWARWIESLPAPGTER